MTRLFEWNKKLDAKEIACVFFITTILFLFGLLLTTIGMVDDDDNHQHAFEGGITMVIFTVCMFISVCTCLCRGIDCNFSKRKKGEKQNLLDPKPVDEEQGVSLEN